MNWTNPMCLEKMLWKIIKHPIYYILAIWQFQISTLTWRVRRPMTNGPWQRCKNPCLILSLYCHTWSTFIHAGPACHLKSVHVPPTPYTTHLTCNCFPSWGRPLRSPAMLPWRSPYGGPSPTYHVENTGTTFVIHILYIYLRMRISASNQICCTRNIDPSYTNT